jgi:hypothetical protein
MGRFAQLFVFNDLTPISLRANRARRLPTAESHGLIVSSEAKLRVSRGVVQLRLPERPLRRACGAQHEELYSGKQYQTPAQFVKKKSIFSGRPVTERLRRRPEASGGPHPSNPMFRYVNQVS